MFREISKIFREMSIELASRRPGGRVFSSAGVKGPFTFAVRVGPGPKLSLRRYLRVTNLAGAIDTGITGD